MELVDELSKMDRRFCLGNMSTEYTDLPWPYFGINCQEGKLLVEERKIVIKCWVGDTLRRYKQNQLHYLFGMMS